ncbi:M20/M25/M40 family metallo-hydrolase [Schaalia sp. ZJ1691]|uniref:M20/M25/M40 family metallo-hydrolase n=1 Tax=Schaalia sp. ZJ1691 TaxID=2709404 RepID=UPI00197EC342|nr:M20/M25/M40 family metallo-hydrolase [Schaalia sp. ZJ1691]
MTNTKDHEWTRDNFAAGSLERETLDLLTQLVRNACVNDLTPDSGNEARSVETLEEYFRDTPVSLRRIEAHPGRTTLVVTVAGYDPDAPSLTLMGHLDVVPVDEDRWSRDPFAAEIAQGAIWGRGTVDMLTLTSAMAVTTRRIATGPKPAGTLTFVAAADEEARGGLGIPWIAREHPDVIPWENCLSEMGGAHIHAADGKDSVVVIVGEKGAAQRRIHVHGDPGHGSVPFGKHSALEAIVEVSRRLRDAGRAIVPSPLWESFVDAFGFDADVRHDLVEGTYDGDFSEFGELAAYAHAISHVTFAQTVMRAGGPINVIPSSAYLEMDIRTLPGVTDDDVDAEIRRALGDLAHCVSIERLLSDPASESPATTRLFESISRVLKTQHSDSRIVPVLFPGGTDLRAARQRGGVGYGFGSHASERTLGAVYSQLHAHDEHMALEDVALTVRALGDVVRDFLRL